MVDEFNIGAQNQHADSGAYEFHIHRAYIIYAFTVPSFDQWLAVTNLVSDTVKEHRAEHNVSQALCLLIVFQLNL